MYHSFIQVGQGDHVPEIYVYVLVLYSKACMKKITHDTDDLQKRLMQTCFDFDRNIIDAEIDVHAGAGHIDTCSDMNVYLYDSSAHFMRLSM